MVINYVQDTKKRKNMQAFFKVIVSHLLFILAPMLWGRAVLFNVIF